MQTGLSAHVPEIYKSVFNYQDIGENSQQVMVAAIRKFESVLKHRRKIIYQTDGRINQRLLGFVLKPHNSPQPLLISC